MSFQDGVTNIYDTIMGIGVTPNSNSPEDLCNAILSLGESASIISAKHMSSGTGTTTISKTHVTTTKYTIVIITSGGSNGGTIKPSCTVTNSGKVTQLVNNSYKGELNSNNVLCASTVYFVDATIGSTITAKSSTYMYSLYRYACFIALS